MHWVVQDNIYQERGYTELMDALKRYKIPHSFVKVIPFIHEIEPDLELTNPVMVMGSVALASKVVKRKGWKPGSFINDNFDYSVWSKHWKDYILNDDAMVYPFKDVPVEQIKDFNFFIRPTKDNKAFTGQIMNVNQFLNWRDRLMDGEISSEIQFNINEQVCISSRKTIYKEFRFFIIDNKIITSTVYKIGNRVIPQDESMVDSDAVKFVNTLFFWQPAKAFCVDVALTEDGYKVIEINNINSSGYYAANMYKIVSTLESIGDSIDE